MENVLKVGDVLIFIRREICYVQIGTSTGEKRHWANNDDKIIVYFIKTEDDFYDLMSFLRNAFGIFLKKTKCLYGRRCPNVPLTRL